MPEPGIVLFGVLAGLALVGFCLRFLTFASWRRGLLRHRSMGVTCSCKLGVCVLRYISALQIDRLVLEIRLMIEILHYLKDITLNYGNYGIFLIFISSTVVPAPHSASIQRSKCFRSCSSACGSAQYKSSPVGLCKAIFPPIGFFNMCFIAAASCRAGR